MNNNLLKGDNIVVLIKDLCKNVDGNNYLKGNDSGIIEILQNYTG